MCFISKWGRISPEIHWTNSIWPNPGTLSQTPAFVVRFHISNCTPTYWPRVYCHLFWLSIVGLGLVRQSSCYFEAFSGIEWKPVCYLFKIFNVFQFLAMKLFSILLLLTDLWGKNLFYKMFIIFTHELKIDF